VTLDELVGSWHISMRHVQLGQPVSGQQRYERVLDGAFVMLDWTFDHPDFPDALALLQDEALHYFDVRGVSRTFALEFTTRGWTLLRKDRDFWQRCAVTRVSPREMTGTGENSHDVGLTWEHDFDITYTRLS
jgi:hypothetical protein